MAIGDRDRTERAQGAPEQPADVTTDEQRAFAAQNEAQNKQQESELRAREETRAEAERVQRETEEVIRAQEPALKVGDGGVKIRYLGTSTAFNVGVADDGRDVLAYAGGDPVDVPQEVWDSIKTLPHDTFQEVK